MPSATPLDFACPFCQQDLSATQELFGQTLACPSCSNEFVVPSLERSSPEVDSSANPITFDCPCCSQNLSAPPELFGKSLECPSCSKEFVVPQPEPVLLENPSLVDSVSPLPQHTAPALWNPNVAAAWSLLFTPAFGSILLAQNARTLGRPEDTATSYGWFGISVAFVALSVYLTATTGDNPLVFWGLVLFAVWYVTFVRIQAKLIAITCGKNYMRKPWSKAVLFALLSCVGVMIGGNIISRNSDGASGFYEFLYGLEDAIPSFESADKVFSKSGEAAINEAHSYFVGIWTYTEAGNPVSEDGVTQWFKFDVRPDGSLLFYKALAVDDGWGEPEKLEWEVGTGKFVNTGKRYYQLKIIGGKSIRLKLTDGEFWDFYRVILEQDGSVTLRVMDSGPVIMKRGDTFPFSD